MTDWRENLSEDERAEIDAEDAVYEEMCRVQRKRAQDAMRRATQRASEAAIPLSDEQRQAMFEIYLEAQIRTDKTGIKHEVDHLVPLCGCWKDNASGRVVHYVRGLHVPNNLRVVTKGQNRDRSNMFFTADPLIVPKSGEYDPLEEYVAAENGHSVDFDDSEIPF